MNIESKAALVIALNARLERCERDLSKAAVAWLEVAGTKQTDEADARARIALGELWRRERLSMLACEVMHSAKDADWRYPSVYFLALDGCDPEAVPSFREWLLARKP